MKKVLSILTALLLLSALALSAFAAELPDVERKGSITFNMDWEGKPLNSGSLSIYQVGEIQVTDGDYGFVLIDSLKSSGLSLENLESADLANAMAKLVKEKKLDARTAKIQNGKAIFRDLPLGLYLVMQEEADASEGFYPINPFLMSLPQKEEGKYLYDVQANPKGELKETPPETSEPPESSEPPSTTEPPETTLPPETTTPPEPGLPQTGQLNWPVPVLGIGGMLLLLVGILLKKERKYEK